MVRTIRVVRAASSNKDKERPAYKRYYKVTLATCYHLLSIAPCGLYINSIKEDDVMVITSSNKGIKISSGLGSKGETNSNRE